MPRPSTVTFSKGGGGFGGRARCLGGAEGAAGRGVDAAGGTFWRPLGKARAARTAAGKFLLGSSAGFLSGSDGAGGSVACGKVLVGLSGFRLVSDMASAGSALLAGSSTVFRLSSELGPVFGGAEGRLLGILLASVWSVSDEAAAEDGAGGEGLRTASLWVRPGEAGATGALEVGEHWRPSSLLAGVDWPRSVWLDVELFEALEATAGVDFPTLDPSGAASSEVRSSLF